MLFFGYVFVFCLIYHVHCLCESAAADQGGSSLNSDLFRLPSGRYVRLSTIAFPTATRTRTRTRLSTTDARLNLYEMTSANVLESHFRTINLSALVHAEYVDPGSRTTTFRVDGKPRTLRPSENHVRVRYGEGLTVFEYATRERGLGSGSRSGSGSGLGLGLGPLRYVYEIESVFVDDLTLTVVRDGVHEDARLFLASRTSFPTLSKMGLVRAASHAFRKRGSGREGAHLDTVGLRQKTGSCKSGTEHYVEVGMAFDHTLCRFYNYDAMKTLMMIEAMFMASSRPFIMDTCIRFALVFVDGYCIENKDPYKSLKNQESFEILPNFILEWRKPEYAGFKRDVVYLATGVNDGSTRTSGSIPGRNGGVCDNQWSYGWLEGINPNVFARSLGQSLGALGRAEGLMQLVYKPGELVAFLAPESVQEIETFIDSNPIANCINTQKPTAPVFPIVTAVPSPTVLPVYGSCAVSRRAANVLHCSKHEQTIGSFRSRKAGRLDVVSFQEFGNFVSILRTTNNGMEIDQFKGFQTMNGSLSKLFLDFDPESTRNGSNTEERQQIRLSIGATVLRWPRPFLTCCDHRLYVFIRVKWCRTSLTNNGVLKQCDEQLKRFSRVVQCISPCYGRSTGRVIPMSETNRCPSCG